MAMAVQTFVEGCRSVESGGVVGAWRRGTVTAVGGPAARGNCSSPSVIGQSAGLRAATRLRTMYSVGMPTVVRREDTSFLDSRDGVRLVLRGANPPNGLQLWFWPREARSINVDSWVPPE